MVEDEERRSIQNIFVPTEETTKNAIKNIKSQYIKPNYTFAGH